jgi:hypothetical protein
VADEEHDLMVVTTASNELEADLACGLLSGAGIRSMHQPSARGGQWSPAGARDVYVDVQNFERAREILSAKGVSEEELAQAEVSTESPTQPTRPTDAGMDG